MESITKHFGEYHGQIYLLNQLQREYGHELRYIGNIEHNFPETIINMSMIPVVYKELSDFKALVELGESNFKFASIWESRRTREVIIAGFKTLQTSIEGIGGAITHELQNLKHALVK